MTETEQLIVQLMKGEALKLNLEILSAMSFCHEARRAEVKKLYCMIVFGGARAQLMTTHIGKCYMNCRIYAANYGTHSLLKESMHTCGALLTTALMNHSLRV